MFHAFSTSRLATDSLRFPNGWLICTPIADFHRLVKRHTRHTSKGKFSVSADVVNTTDEAQSGLVIYAAYDGSDKLVKVDAETITELAANGTFPVEFAIADGAEKYKILVWNLWKSMLPIAASVDVD